MELKLATTFRERLVGLAFTRERAACLLLPRCRSVHTFGMRYPLDLYWLDGDHDLVRLDRAVPPRRFVSCREAAAVLEVPASRPSPPAAAA